MITREQQSKFRAYAATAITEGGIALLPDEVNTIDVADFGLSDVEVEGALMLTMVDTEKVAAKVIVLLPNQTLPEHWHTATNDKPGKEETLRVAQGMLRLYVPGEDTLRVGFIPKGKQACYSSRHEIVLQPGEQKTLPSGTKHWMQAGTDGAVVYSFSSYAYDALDPFTDPNVIRVTKVVD